MHAARTNVLNHKGFYKYSSWHTETLNSHTMLCIAGIMTTRTTLLEPSGNIYLCEGDHVTLQCNVSSGSIVWMWFANSTKVEVIYIMLDGKKTRTDGSITTQYSGNDSSNLTFQYRVSHLIPSTIICNNNHLVKILTQGNNREYELRVKI